MLYSHYELEDLGKDCFRHTQHMRQIAFERNGAMRRIGNLVTATGDPNFPQGVDELCQFRIDRKIAGNSPLVHFGKGKSFARFALVGANNVSGTKTDNGFVFKNAWNNCDLTYIIGGHRLEERILLKTGHVRTFGFTLAEHSGFDPATLTFGSDFRILQPTLEPPAGSKPMLSIPLQWIVTQQGGKWQLSVTLPAGNYAGWTFDPTLVLQPDEADGMDARIIDGGLAGNNWGTGVEITAGNWSGHAFIQRTLIKFDLSLLPAGAVISAATLSLYCTSDLADNGDTFRVYRQKRAWVEDQVNWNAYSAGNNWSTAGGFHVDDCEQTDIGSRVFTAAEALNVFKDFPLTPVTKAALDLGNGWLIKTDAEAANLYEFASSDHATANIRPYLTIDYTLPAAGGPTGNAAFSKTFSQTYRGLFG